MLGFFVSKRPNWFKFFHICWQFELYHFCCLNFFKLFLLRKILFQDDICYRNKSVLNFSLKSSMLGIFLMFVLIIDFVTFFVSWISLSAYYFSIVFFHLYCGCLSSSIAFLDSLWFLSELRLDEDLKVWEVWDDDLINSLNSALRDTGSNLIVRKTFQMLTLSPLYCALYSCICYMSLEISPSRTIQKS